MPANSKAIQYVPSEINLEALSDKAFDILGKHPFQWQLDAAKAILCGEDVVLDVGTGSGKSLCFTLPLLLNNSDISVTISPLTALMKDQTRMSGISGVAVCKETLTHAGPENLYKEIIAGKFQQVFVSPEIATSSEFHKAVLSKSDFAIHLRAINIDEAHCITLWGGSFRKDYAGLGVLRARFPKNVPLLVASATLPEHVLDDIKATLQLKQSVKMIQISNARPNIALSVRVMQHSEDSKADLRFLIPAGGKIAADIPITLAFCNSRIVTEDCTDRARDWAADCGIDSRCIRFYHSSIGEAEKRDIETLLEREEIRIVFCTDAVGMGCDMRNIEQVVLWGLPPSFCSLVQRAGRAGRDLTKMAEAILIVPKSIIKNGVTDNDIDKAMTDMLAEADNQEPAGTRDPQNENINNEGVRMPDIEDSDHEVEEDDVEKSSTSTKKSKKISGWKGKQKTFSRDMNVKEAKALSDYATTKQCRRNVWNNFFENDKKLQLKYLENTSYKDIPGARCCDNTEPRLFPIEKVMVTKEKGLKRGKKKGFTEMDTTMIRDTLKSWREDTLLDAVYPGIETFSGRALLGDDIIEKLATCGEFMASYEELQRHVRWPLGQDANDKEKPSQIGEMLLVQLEKIYDAIDKRREEQEQLEYAENASQEFTFETAPFIDAGWEAPPDRGTSSKYKEVTFSRNLTAEDYSNG